MEKLVTQRSQITDAKEMDPGTTLRLLADIDRTGVVSQRLLATRLGIAVGLTNAYVKRLVRKGWVKVQKVPARRYKYFLTPEGFVEKSRLTAEYLSFSLAFFRRAREQCLDLLRECEHLGRTRVALFGASELAEIATLAARETSVKIVAIAAPGKNAEKFAGLPVANGFDDLPPFDAILVTDTSTAQVTYELLQQRVAEDQILTPPLLHISRVKSSPRDD
jgi:DNA-binding MarR family transcriptional regulator